MKRVRTWRLGSMGICAVLVSGMLSVYPSGAAALPSVTTTRVNVASDGTQANNFSSSESPRSISGDGRFVVFSSSADNLVAGDTNNVSDVFVRDRLLQQTKRISVGLAGVQANDLSGSASISTNGRFIAYISFANNLTAGDTNGHGDVFLYDRQTGTTTRVSVASDGSQGDADSGFVGTPKVSNDGRVVSFESMASNLVPGDTNGTVDVFVRDVQTGTTTRVSVASDGSQGDGDSHSQALSDDGHYVAFLSSATNLVPGDTNGVVDIFVHDQLSGTTRRVSVASDGSQSNGGSELPSLSADGRYVAFESVATNLVSSDNNGTAFDIFVYDQRTGVTTLESRTSKGIQGNSDSRSASISADGKFVAFHSFATNFDSGDVNNDFDVFVKDRCTGTITRADVASNGKFGNAGAVRPSISADGRFVSFDSTATNLVKNDTNNFIDIFVRQRF